MARAGSAHQGVGHGADKLAHAWKQTDLDTPIYIASRVEVEFVLHVVRWRSLRHWLVIWRRGQLVNDVGGVWTTCWLSKNNQHLWKVLEISPPPALPAWSSLPLLPLPPATKSQATMVRMGAIELSRKGLDKVIASSFYNTMPFSR